MEYTLAADPFSILTVVVAPAVLTNASSVLALGTKDRLARVADRTHAITAQLAKLEPGAKGYEVAEAQLPDLQTRAQLLLRALRCFYLGLGLFASSALISIAGSIAVYYGGRSAFQTAAGIGVVCLSLSGRGAGLRLCPDDSGNAARSQRLSLRSEISHRLRAWPNRSNKTGNDAD